MDPFGIQYACVTFSSTHCPLPIAVHLVIHQGFVQVFQKILYINMILRRHISNKKYVDTYVPYLLGGPEVIIPTFKIFFRHYSGQTNKLAEGAAST